MLHFCFMLQATHVARLSDEEPSSQMRNQEEKETVEWGGEVKAEAGAR